METIKLDLIPGKKMPSLHASQYDKETSKRFELCENRVPFELDGTETLSIIVRKVDNALVSMDIANVFGGKTYVDFLTTEQMCACAGYNFGELRIERNGERLGTGNFYLCVETAPDENGITSQSDIKNLERQVHDIVVEELADNGAEETGYDNTESGLTATNVQDAIDELASQPSVDAYTKQESDEKYATKTELSNKADVSAIPTKTSQLQNDSGFAQIDDSEESASKTWSSEKIGDLLDGKVSKVDAPSYNIFNGEFLAVDGYITGTAFQEANGYKTTKPIYLSAGNYYYNLVSSSYGSSAKFFSRTNAEATTFSKMTATLTGETLVVDGVSYDIYAFTITEPDYYIFNASVGVWSQYFMITNQTNGIPTRYVPYQEVKKIESGVLLNDDMIEEILGLHKLNPLYEGSLSADGDSICWGNGYRGGYAKIISDNNSMQYENLAVGGATIVSETYYDGGAARHWISRSMQNLSTNADYILIEGGVNDASLGVTLGALSNGYEATLDDTTFYGAIETIFKTLTTKYVGKKYGFIIPHRMTAGMFPDGNYYNAIVESGAKWGVPILDLTKSVPPFNSFRHNDTYDAIRTAYTTDGDGWHPTELCYNKYYVPQIESWLKTL